MSDLPPIAYWACPEATDGAARLDYVYGHPGLEAIRRFRDANSGTRLGQYLDGSPQYGASESGTTSGDVPFVSIQHIAASGCIEFRDDAYIDAASDSHTLRSGDIVVARTGFTLGKAALAGDTEDGFAFGSFCLRLRLLPVSDDDGYLPEFITAFLNSELGRQQFELLQTGSDKKNVNQDQVCDVRLPRLTPSQQAELLGSLSDTRKTALDAAARAAGLFSVVLADFEGSLSGRSWQPRAYAHRTNKGVRASFWTGDKEDPTSRLDFEHLSPVNLQPLVVLKGKYGLTTLGEAADAIFTGDTLAVDEQGTALGVKAACVQRGLLRTDGLVSVADDGEVEHLKRGDVLVVNIGHGSLGNVCVFDQHTCVIPGPEVTVVRLSADYDPHFVAFYLLSRFGQSQFCRWFSGSSGQLHIYDREVASFLLPLASEDRLPLKAQHAMAAEARSKFEEARALQQQSEAAWDHYYECLAAALV